MAQNLKHRVQMVLEVTRGTAVTPMTLELPIVGDGARPSIVAGLGEILASTTFPYVTDQVPVGVTGSFAITVEVNRDNIRDLILLATKRTAGVLPAVTIVHDQQGVGAARYSGCVCDSLNFNFSRGASPGQDNLLTCTMNFQCMAVENGQGSINAGLSPANAPRFQIRHGTYTFNSVAASEALNLAIGIANELALGPVDASNKRLYIEDGRESQSISATKRFATTAWRALAEGQTEFAASLVLATGTANETVTATIGKAKAATRNVAEADGVVTEEIALMPYHTGSVAPLVWSFGSAIGASVLGL